MEPPYGIVHDEKENETNLEDILCTINHLGSSFNYGLNCVHDAEFNEYF